ncbi:MAG: type I DNA topoisomerase [Acidobacteriota bacterium]
MSKLLVIVESPAKAKTINKFLGKDYTVKASMGHIRDLPKSKLGVNEENSFEPTYKVLPDKVKVVAELKKASMKAKEIFLAPDPDREGEAICWHLKEELKRTKAKFHRVLFNEITKRAVLEAFQNPSDIDTNKVDAQQARRIVDRLVGYKISPLLWEKVRRGLSAGRVQSVALRIICDREREIKAFVPEEYWTIIAHLASDKPPVFKARLIEEKGEKIKIPNESEAKRVVAALEKADFIVEKIDAKEKKKSPPPPFLTSKLQQDAYRKFGFPVKKTMRIAQDLYEGKDLGDLGTVGLITYMRTDSTRVSMDAIHWARRCIVKNFGNDYLPEKPRIYKSRKGAQEAHEAIRPTSCDLPPEKVRKYLTSDELKLYTQIWNRFIASQMESAAFDTTTVDVRAGDFLLRTSGSVMKFPGWLAVYRDFEEKEADESREGSEEKEALQIPPLEEGKPLKLERVESQQDFTQPPPRFSEGTLVKELEENGIGRPSTYATIIATLQNRDYVNKDKGKFVPTELGFLIADLMVEHFGDIVDIGYTARLEEELDEIEEGKLNWIDALKEFNDKFNDDLKRAEAEMKDVKREEIPTELNCPECGKPMVKKWGRYGYFLACSGYPDCKHTQELAENGEEAHEFADETEETCEKCGNRMVVKKGRFGRFLACSAYPACKNTKKIIVNHEGKVETKEEKTLDEKCPKCGKNLIVKHGRFGEFTTCSNYPKCKYIKHKETGVKCPEKGCGGMIVEKKSRRGRIFYGCGHYPKCKFVIWQKPIKEKCPECGAEFLVEKVSKKSGRSLQCLTDGCSFKTPLPS